jgi:hypothetical protein
MMERNMRARLVPSSEPDELFRGAR